MALHVREQIAVAVLAAVTGLTTTGARVYRDRDTEERPLQSSELPGLTFDDDGEPAEIITLGTGRILQRLMRVRIAAHVRSASGYSATLNLILQEVEVALAAAALGGAKYCALIEVAARDVSEAADITVVRQTFTFELPYYTAHDAPDTAL